MHQQTGLDPLIRMAVGHYQFEAIHPFSDGNGRTGRVINILYLIQQELLNLPILYLSRHAIAHKADHYGLLLGVTRDQAWEPWLQFMLQAVAETSQWTTTPCSLMADADRCSSPARTWSSSSQLLEQRLRPAVSKTSPAAC